METFANFAVSKHLAKLLTAKLSIECGGVIINGRAITLDNGDSVGVIDVAAGKAVFGQQQLPKPPRRQKSHGSFDQRSSSFIYDLVRANRPQTVVSHNLRKF